MLAKSGIISLVIHADTLYKLFQPASQRLADETPFKAKPKAGGWTCIFIPSFPVSHAIMFRCDGLTSRSSHALCVRVCA